MTPEEEAVKDIWRYGEQLYLRYKRDGAVAIDSLSKVDVAVGKLNRMITVAAGVKKDA